MEKWHLAGIISNDSRRPALILPAEKPQRNTPSPSKEKLVFFLRGTVRKITEVIALF